LIRKEIDDVILGCECPKPSKGLNVARIASLRAGLPLRSLRSPSIASARRLQAIALAAERIGSGGAEVIVAGGTGIYVDDPDGRT